MKFSPDKGKLVKGLEVASWILTTVSTVILNGEATTEKKRKLGLSMGLASAVALSITEYLKENVSLDKEDKKEE